MATLDAAQRRYIRTETAVSTVINTIISAVFVWIVFRGMSDIPLWGSRGLAVDLIPTCFAITLVSALVLTLVTRVRMKNGRIAGTGRADGVASWLPSNLMFRAIGAALAVTLVAVPLTTAVLVLVNADGASYSNVLVFKIVYGALLSIAISPPLLKRALADRAGAA